MLKSAYRYFMSKTKLVLISLAQALSVFVYILLVSQVISIAEQMFNKPNKFWAPVAFLLLFVLSAAITGLLVLGKPITLYLEDFKKEAIELFGYTIGWLALIAIVVFIILASLK